MSEEGNREFRREASFMLRLKAASAMIGFVFAGLV